MKHLAAQLRICRLYWNIDRRQLKPDNPLNILILHIRQRDIVALQERKSGIIVLKIQCLTHARRHLVDETEDALIPAGTIIAHQTIFKGNPQILILIYDIQFPLLAVLLADQQRNLLTVYLIFIIKNILYLISIDRQKDVPRLQLHFLRNRARIDRFYQMTFFHL